MNIENVDMDMSPQQEEEDEDDLYCNVCKVQLATDVAFRNHVRGMMHTQKVMQQDSSEQGQQLVEPEPVPISDILRKAKEAQRYQEGGGQTQSQQRAPARGKHPPKPEEKEPYYCEICEIHCTGITSWEAHLGGQRHQKNIVHRERGAPISGRRGPNASGPGQPSSGSSGVRSLFANMPLLIQPVIDNCSEPLIGLQYILENRVPDDMYKCSYSCALCDSHCFPKDIMKHVVGPKHQLAYLKEHYMHYHMLVKQMPGKKADQNKMLTEYARSIEMQEGRREVQVKMELNSSFNKTLSQKRKTESQLAGAKKSRGNDFQAGGSGGSGGQKWGTNNYGEYDPSYGQNPYNNQQLHGRGYTADGYGYDQYNNYVGGYAGGYVSNQGPHNTNKGRPSHDYTSDNPEYGSAPGSYPRNNPQSYSTHAPPMDINRTSNAGQESAQSSSNSTAREGYKGYCSKTDMNFFLQSLANTEYSVTNEEEASLALQVSNSLTQALFQYRLKSVPKELLGGFSKQGIAASAKK